MLKKAKIYKTRLALFILDYERYTQTHVCRILRTPYFIINMRKFLKIILHHQ